MTSTLTDMPRRMRFSWIRAFAAQYDETRAPAPQTRWRRWWFIHAKHATIARVGCWRHPCRANTVRHAGLGALVSLIGRRKWMHSI